MREVTLTSPGFLNETGMAIADSVKDILFAGIGPIAASLKDPTFREQFVAVTEKVIVVIGESTTVVRAFVVAPNMLRETLVNLTSSASEGDWVLRTIPESTLRKCEAKQSAGVVRVLFITPEITGTCRVGQAEALGVQVKEDEAAVRATENVLKHLSKLNKNDARKVLRSVEALLNNAGARELMAKGHELSPMFFNFIDRVTKAPMPHSFNTAGNMETLAMSSIYAFQAVPLLFDMDGLKDEALDDAKVAGEALLDFVGELTDVYPALRPFLQRSVVLFDDHPSLQSFCSKWMFSNFARLEIGHKLAASLCLTDVPDDIEVQAPWDAWSLVVPDGLLGMFEHTAEGEVSYVARLWCVGAEMRFIVLANGKVWGPFKDLPPDASPRLVAFANATRSLVRGACLALADPEEYKKDRILKKSSGSSKSKRSGPPELEQARFMLSAPVTLDLREPLLDYLRGNKSRQGGPITSQFLVRGHWRQQVHGAGRLLRKKLWIKPFWKGDENARILLRNYKVKEEESNG